MAAARDDLLRRLTYHGVEVIACRCDCHRDGDASPAFAAMATAYGYRGSAVDVTDPAAAVLACDTCRALHCPALVVDHDRQRRERDRVRDRQITHPAPNDVPEADAGPADEGEGHE